MLRMSKLPEPDFADELSDPICTKCHRGKCVEYEILPYSHTDNYQATLAFFCLPCVMSIAQGTGLDPRQDKVIVFRNADGTYRLERD